MSIDEQFFLTWGLSYRKKQKQKKMSPKHTYIKQIAARKIRKQKKAYRPTIILNLHYGPFLSIVGFLPFKTIDNIVDK